VIAMAEILTSLKRESRKSSKAVIIRPVVQTGRVETIFKTFTLTAHRERTWKEKIKKGCNGDDLSASSLNLIFAILISHITFLFFIK
jgi:hypothetical protein